MNKKKIVISAIFGVMAIAMSACGDSAKKDEIMQETVQDTAETLVHAEDEEPETNNEKPEEKEIPLLSVVAERNGLFYCIGDGVKKYIVDENADIVVAFPQELDMVEFARFDDGSFFKGDYFMMKDNSIWNLAGEKVFSLADSEYDEIFYTDTLDAGYIILSKMVNTFEETGAHYFAYNLKDGTSFEFEGESCPGQEYWFYFGNGNFIYARPDSGFGREHIVYHLQKNESIPASMLHADGEITTIMPDIHFWNKLNYDDNALYGIYEDDDDLEYRMIYRFDTGQAELSTLQEFIDIQYERIFYERETGVDCVVQMLGKDSDWKDHPMLLNYVTGILTPMDDYKKYEVLYQKDGAYLCRVENEGGGRFYTVVEPDGTRRFDPIPDEGPGNYNDNYIALYNESDTTLVVYNWDGDEIAVIEEAFFNCAFGTSAIVYTHYAQNSDEYATFLLDTKTGSTTEIKPLQNGERQVLYKADLTDFYEDGYFVSRGTYLKEDGTFRLLKNSDAK